MWHEEKGMNTREAVVIVGGGLAGLFVARTLRMRHHTQSLILEASKKAGGLIQSVYNDEGRVMYESTLCQILSSHTRALELCKALKVELRPTKMRAPTQRQSHTPGLSQWEAVALTRRNPLSADHADLLTGCSDHTQVESTPFCHATDAIDIDQYTSDNGFSQLVDKLVQDTRILYDTRVVDIRRTGVEYKVQCRCRENDKFVNRIYTATVVFICVPPHAAERWTIVSQWARAQLYTVQSSPLNRIYAQTSAPTSFHTASSMSLLGQSIASQFNNEWFQASYTGGRLARFWHNLRMLNPAQFVTLLIAEVRRSLHLIPRRESFVSCYKEHGYHFWRANPMFNIDKAVRACVMPNPKHLPNVFWCGEAFSSHQGWMEGALETAELAVNIFTKSTSYVFPRRGLGSDEVIIEGRILDVSKWANVHPGGIEAIRTQESRNASDLFYHNRHSDNAWAIVHALQVAVEN